jgi:pimeloyl-ACP methyl ester carboxylesterase
MPAHADGPRSLASLELVAGLREGLVRRDQTAIMAALLAMQPKSVRERLTVKVWARRQADAVVSMNLLPLIDRLTDALPPVAEALGAIDVPVLVIAQRDDPMHPVDAARRLAELLPHAELVVSDVPWVWSAREQLRERVAGFLA